jgi:hypothetical protein
VLRLYESDLPASGTAGATLYKVTSSWGTTPTNLYNVGVGSGASGWYDSTNLDLYTDIDITAWVQGWLADPSSNYGLSIRAASESAASNAKWWDGYYGVTGPQLLITIPEPGTIWLLASAALAGLGVLAYARRISR